MLQISDDQVDRLRAQRLSLFEERLFKHARSHLRERCAHVSDDSLQAAVRKVVGDARAVGLRSERGVALYFNVAVFFGMDFLHNDQIDWVLPITQAEGEELDPLWILRVSETATQTLKMRGL